MPISINSGKYKNKKIDTPADVRPTLMRNRKSLFDILWSLQFKYRNYVSNARVLDCFAGSGAFGFESLSNGSDCVTFVDSSWDAIEIIKKNADKLDLANHKYTVIHGLVEKVKNINKTPYDLVFLDPPYDKSCDLIPKVLKNLLLNDFLCEESLIIIEIPIFLKTLDLTEFNIVKEKVTRSSKFIFCRQK